MKEIRPSTWITLAVLALLIFVPALLIDVESLEPPVNEPDSTIKPIDPFANKAKPSPKGNEEPPPGPTNLPEDVHD